LGAIFRLFPKYVFASRNASTADNSTGRSEVSIRQIPRSEENDKIEREQNVSLLKGEKEKSIGRKERVGMSVVLGRVLPPFAYTPSKPLNVLLKPSLTRWSGFGNSAHSSREAPKK